MSDGAISIQAATSGVYTGIQARWKTTEMPRLLIAIVFIVANLFSQMAVAYDCAHLAKAPDKSCCCAQDMAGPAPCSDKDRCGAMPAGADGPCCEQVLTTVDAGETLGNAAIGQTSPSSPQWMTAEILYRLPPAEADAPTLHTEADVPRPRGTPTYLETARLRI